ncbi:MAG TPA: bifunctional diguanylate cyclase/phosphodiesterase [Xanthomonadales bacterium]|nr:bifunctional diguanylate cyclase/phosphodiesterase [Xanthomonadales bacterium]
MTRPLIRGSVLIVVTDREDRRALFEVFDTYEFDAIFTAKDFAQAHAFLGQEARIDVVLLEFRDDAREALDFCTALRARMQGSPIPVIGIANAEDLRTRWTWEDEPDVVSDWLRSPVIGEEALHRIQNVLMRATATAAAPNAGPAGSATGGGDQAGFRFAFDGSPVELVLWDLNTGLVLDANTAFEQVGGTSRARLVGTPFFNLDHQRDQAVQAGIVAKLRREGRIQHRVLRSRADGHRELAETISRLAMRGNDVLVLTAFQPVDDNVAIESALTAMSSVTQVVGADTAAACAGQLAAWLKPEHLWIVARRGDHEEPPDILYQHQHPVAAAAVLDWNEVLKRLETGETVFIPEGAAQKLAGDRSIAGLGLSGYAAVPLCDERRELLGALVVGALKPWTRTRGVREVIEAAASRVSLALELDRAREQGRAKGLQDSLTQLPNRLLFNDRLETTIKEAHRTGEMFAVLFVDLDRFKTINDSLGHGVGDEVLVAVARRLRGSVRGSDTVARYAGDEFTLILRHIVQRDDVLRIADKICRVLEAPLPLSDGRELHITSSIGISFYPDDAATAEKLLHHADVAMYSAKGMGRNTYQTYVAVPEESHQQRLALEAKLRQAERTNELRVYYQPQVSAQSEDIVGMEALIRWEHPELGMISPGFFIPLAEETGLIVSIGEWVMRQACSDAKKFNQRFGLNLRIGVNLSALQLRQPNLVEVVKRALDDTGLEAQYLELEVTESLSVKTIPNLLETLQSLRELGCKIAIDDFGTGQSSLDYIRRFPADRIKIDQVFVRNIGVDPDDEAIVRATIHMAHNLNRHVVAEGVEYEEHFSFLRDQGCEELQGYLFCRPLPCASFENLLAEREKLLARATG